MPEAFHWSKETYERSISSHCWDFTPYDAGWGPSLAADGELREIVRMEYELGTVPDWAGQIVDRCIDAAQPCGHYLFPRGFRETISAIGSQRPPSVVHSCFMVDDERKRQAMDYALCLDAWLAGAQSEAVANELMAFGFRKIDWHSVCSDLWEVLGEHVELKDLLVERLLHRLRHSIKATVWDDDIASRLCRDEYLGDYIEKGGFGGYGNPTFPLHGYDEGASPRIIGIERRIAEICAKGSTWDSDWKPWIEWWLCAPKSFRFLERKLWEIGKLRLAEKDETIPPFLRCEDTYPNQDEASLWWRSFSSALKGWGQGNPESGGVANDVNKRLGEATPVKRWLVRLFLRKLDMLVANDEQLTQLVRADHDHMRGTKPLT
jgi:hypothetical protein